MPSPPPPEKQKVLRGRPTWAKGPVHEYLMAAKDDWLEATSRDSTATFYDKVTSGIINLVGHEGAKDIVDGKTMLPKKKRKKGRQQDNDTTAESEQQEPGVELTEEELAQQKSEVWDELRMKVVAWCNHAYKKFDNLAVLAEVKRMIHITQGIMEEKVYKMHDINYYEKTYFDDRLKTDTQRRMDEALESWNASNRTTKKPAFLSILHTIAKEHWQRESQDFQDKLRVANEQDYQERRAAAKAASEYATKLDKPQTPQEYAAALDTSGVILQAVAEAMAQRTGMLVSILMVGPVANKGGQIQMRSVHQGEISERSGNKKWPAADPLAFTELERSFCAFARRFFTPEECAARAIPGTAEGVQYDVPSAPSTTNLAPIGLPATPAQDQRPLETGTPAHSAQVVTPVARHEALQNAPSRSSTPGSELPRQVATLRGLSSRRSSPVPPSVPSTPGSRSSTPGGTTAQTPRVPRPRLWMRIESPEASDQHAERARSEFGPLFPAPETPAGQSDTHSPAATSASTTSALPRLLEPCNTTQPLPSTPSITTPAYQPAGNSVEDPGTCNTSDGSPADPPLPPLPPQPVSPQLIDESVIDPRLLQQDDTADSVEHFGGSTSAAVHAALASFDFSGASVDVASDYKVLLGHTWGSKWASCILAFLTREQGAGFVDPPRRQLPCELRPSVYAHWIKVARPRTPPAINDVNKFAADLEAWYRRMQPCKRTDDRQEHPESCNDMLKYGRNGLYLVVLGLCWLGHAIFDDAQAHLQPLWLELVGDLTWVLSSATPLSAAAAGPANDDPASAKRKASTAAVVPRKRARSTR
ncbi:hypothetical protein PHLGIDRAFT_17371 [Phlebiopsis gigantea 11061_1 CR5-6]|uniref:Uncharacterized protein n=1 Tax=Phlebiopsis gigantea (strain 11061_1 CR5-6) TaxID=745531 RepID=A0A0C3RP72_PHLG1|nr:hypothetical protein PHLGIDRAFT_17371 [Phlebiopsis gigantea 11061_1 CR5-6]